MEFLDVDDVSGAPPQAREPRLQVAVVSAVELQQKGLTATYTLPPRGGVFREVHAAASIVHVAAKDRLVYSALGSADVTMRRPADFQSGESHGLQRYLEDGRAVLTVERTPHRLLVTISAVARYRIAQDEWIFFNLFDNASVPSACATGRTAIVHVEAFRYNVITEVTQWLCAAVVIVGIVAAVAGTSIPTSHHAGVVAVIARMHYAQEDGRPLPLVLHPGQWAFGHTKYRYVAAALISNVIIVVAVFAAQWIAVRIFTNVQRLTVCDAELRARSPRVSAAVVTHLAPATLFCIARNFGNLGTASYAMTSAASLLLLLVLFAVHRIHVSFVRFDAEFVPGPPPGVAMEGPVSGAGSLMRSLQHGVSGWWRPTDPAKSFVTRHGYVFEAYREPAKAWLALDFGDAFLTCALFSALDNYTLFLSLYQFGCTLVVKAGVLVAVALFSPLVSHHSSVVLLLVLGAEFVAMLALTIGSLQQELLGATTVFQTIACAVGALLLLFDCGIAAIRGVAEYYQFRQRPRFFEERPLDECPAPEESLARWLHTDGDVPLLPLPPKQRPADPSVGVPSDADNLACEAEQALDTTHWMRRWVEPEEDKYDSDGLPIIPGHPRYEERRLRNAHRRDQKREAQELQQRRREAYLARRDPGSL